MAEKVILWRHGQTDFNVNRRIQGSSDVPLNEMGERQAREAAAWLALLKPRTVIASPLLRARATACALSGLLGLEVNIDSRLTERCFGLWEGMSGREIELAYPEQYRAWRRGEDPVGVDVESRVAVGRRVHEAVEEWADGVEGTLVVVSHGAAIKCGITNMLGEDPSSWAGISVMENCHWATMERLKRPEERSLGNPGEAQISWRVVSYNAGDGIVGNA